MASAGKKVTFTSKNAKGDAPGMMFGDPGTGKAGLIVMHEWWGLTEQIQKDAVKIAEEGHFVVLVPDCYRGKVAIDFETAGHLMTGLDWDGAVKDVQGAAQFLLNGGCDKVGVTGFCMGGILAFLACLLPEISASAPFYGAPSEEQGADKLMSTTVPIQAHFALQDTTHIASPDFYRPFVEKLKAAGVKVELKEYDVGHGFVNPTSPSYNKDVAQEALQSMYDFMQKSLA